MTLSFKTLVVIISTCMILTGCDETAVTADRTAPNAAQPVAAASQTPATTNSQTGQTEEITRQATPPTQQTPADVDATAATVIKNGELYHYGKKQGYTKDGRIYIAFHDTTVSFEGDPEKLEFLEWPPENVGFAYDGLTVSTTFGGPFGYEDIKYNKISYKCDGSLVKTTNPKEDVPNYYCVTNGRDSLSQFEFSGAGGYVVSTGAEAGQSWYKLYLKRIYGTSYIFAGSICDHQNEEPFYYNADDYNKMLDQDKISICSAIYGGGYNAGKAYKKIANITYLNRLLKSDYTQNQIQSWDKMVETFRVEQK